MLEKYRRIKLALIIFISIITIFVGFTIYSLGWTNIKIGIRYIQLFPFRSVNELKFKSARKSDDKLTLVEMVEDLNQLKKDILEVHPSTIEGLSKNQKKLFEEAYEKVKKPMAVFEFNILISEVLSTLQDAHSKTYLSNNQGEIFPFLLKSCIPGDDYDHFLRKMFIDIKENNVENIIVDLRGNTGGNDKVTDDFIAYISNEGKMMKNGLSVRFSEQAALQRGYLSKKGIKNFAPNNLMLDTLFISRL